MRKIKISDIYDKNNKYKEITSKDLLYTEISPIDMISVKKLVKNELIRLYLLSITLLFFLILSFYLLYKSTILTNTLLTEELALMLVIIISIFICLVYNFKKIYSFIYNSKPKAQYGIVQSKYTLKSEANADAIINYYINVNFDFNNTYIRKVKCTESIYNNLTVGSDVLVVSFNNKKTYATIPYKNTNK